MGIYNFKGLVGNNNVLVPLKNLLMKNRLPNLTIFGGEMGMGKSTTALITAMRLTCDSPKGPEPCLECEICKANLQSLSSSGHNMYVTKKDMSKIGNPKQMDDLMNIMFSQRGVAGNSVYILDEFQSIGEDLQTKMLEQLDRQDKSIYIILTCTDLHKILDTIKSRTVPFIFSRFTAEESRILAVRECNRLGMGNPSVGFTDLVIRSSKGVARNITKIIELAYNADLNEETLRNFLGEVPIPVYIMLLDLALKDESMALTHLESSLSSYPIGSFVLGYKSFIEKLIFCRKTGNSSFFSDEEVDLIKSYPEANISKLLTHTLRLANNSNSTDVRLHFVHLMEVIRGKSVAQANSEKITTQMNNAARASIENTSMEFELSSGKTNISSFDEELTLDSLKGMKK